MLTLLKYLFLAIVQGITEPIPVSSSGHLVIIRNLIHMPELTDLNFEIILNFGSFLAIVVFFWKDIVEIIKDFFSYLATKEEKYHVNYKYAWYIVLATIPAGLLGIILKDYIENVLSSVKIVGVALLITALFLYLIRNIKGTKEDKDLTWKDAIAIGLFQTVALFPGISRSGSTIVGGMFRGLKRDTAFKFSFMLYLPISLATMVLGVKDLLEANIGINMWACYLFCMIITSIITYFSTKWFNGIMKTGKLIYFVWYCLIVGSLVIIFL